MSRQGEMNHLKLYLSLSHNGLPDVTFPTHPYTSLTVPLPPLMPPRKSTPRNMKYGVSAERLALRLVGASFAHLRLFFWAAKRHGFGHVREGKFGQDHKKVGGCIDMGHGH